MFDAGVIGDVADLNRRGIERGGAEVSRQGARSQRTQNEIGIHGPVLRRLFPKPVFFQILFQKDD